VPCLVVDNLRLLLKSVDILLIKEVICKNIQHKPKIGQYYTNMKERTT
jgi:hypothetical protein